MSRPTGVDRTIRHHLLAGWIVVVVMVAGVGGWAATTEISGAIIAPGALVVDSNVKRVQHATGGVVGEILARDGDKVAAGQIIVRLDETIVRASLSIVLKSLSELHARKARLEAERDDAGEMHMPDGITPPLPEAEFTSAFAGERKLFEIRRTARIGQKDQLRKRIAQLSQERRGIEIQHEAKARELVLIGAELSSVRTLWQQNLVPITKMTAVEREGTKLAGERGQLETALAQAAGRIAEVELQIIQIDRDLASEVGRELREVDGRIGELVERRIAAEDQLRRIVIRAPQAGVVHQSVVHTVGGVLSAGETIMVIVPYSERLIVEARVAPRDIDQVHPGQTALLRLSAFDQSVTPELIGKVLVVGADVTTDGKSGIAYYTVRVAITSLDIAKRANVLLVPGMPIEVFLKTRSRKVVSLMIKPLLDQLRRAFRES